MGKIEFNWELIAFFILKCTFSCGQKMFRNSDHRFQCYTRSCNNSTLNSELRFVFPNFSNGQIIALTNCVKSDNGNMFLVTTGHKQVRVLKMM